VCKSITCAGEVIESASSRITILNGGQGFPLQASTDNSVIHDEQARLH